MAKSKNKRKKSKSKKKSATKAKQASQAQATSQSQTSEASQNTQVSSNKPRLTEAKPELIVDLSQVSHDPQPASKNSTSSRALMLILIIFFSAQMWAAGSYYWGDYPWDERFSWRMFSTVRSLSCQVQMWESSEHGQLCPDGQTAHCTQVRLSSRYHMVWVNLLKRGRLQVLKKLTEEECSQAQSDKALFVNLTCPSPQPPHHQITIQSPKVNLCEKP